jgi:hypothetical protein
MCGAGGRWPWLAWKMSAADSSSLGVDVGLEADRIIICGHHAFQESAFVVARFATKSSLALRLVTIIWCRIALS